MSKKVVKIFCKADDESVVEENRTLNYSFYDRVMPYSIIKTFLFNKKYFPDSIFIDLSVNPEKKYNLLQSIIAKNQDKIIIVFLCLNIVMADRGLKFFYFLKKKITFHLVVLTNLNFSHEFLLENSIVDYYVCEEWSKVSLNIIKSFKKKSQKLPDGLFYRIN